MTAWIVAAIALAGALILAGMWGRAREEAQRLRASLAGQQAAERLSLAASLQSSQSMALLFQRLVPALDSPLLVADAEGRLLVWNDAAAALFAAGQPVAESTRLRDAIRSFAFIDTIDAALRTGAMQSSEGEAGPGQVQVYALAAIPVETPEGRRVLVLLNDRSSSAAFHELRREFVTNVTHELKTPLTNIVGATETLLGGAMDDTEFRGRFLEIIQRNAEQLRALIEDLLAIARSEEEAAPASEGEACEYRAIRDMVLHDLASAADTAHVVLRVQSLATPMRLAIAPAGCYMVLKNLTENAIRYNKPGGSVEYSERLLAGMLEVSIRDTGIGIAPPDLARIFERFYRADKQRSRAIGGTGLGLAIVKNLVERHGGSIDVMSQPGLGSTFILTLPIAETVRTVLLVGE